jgi:hypothetical protein
MAKERNFIVHAIDKLSDVGKRTVVGSAKVGRKAKVVKRVSHASGSTAKFIKRMF